MVEVGIPYSDPIADGPVISASYHRALTRGVKLDHIFQTLRTLRAETSNGRLTAAPIVTMVSYAIIHRTGAENYLHDAAAAGVDGLIVPDLPVEESEGSAPPGDRPRPEADPARHADHPARARLADRPDDDRVPLLRLGGRDHRRA